MTTPEALASIRAAAEPQPPTSVSWAPAVRTALEWPAVAPFLLETSEQARRREFRDRLMQEYVYASMVLTPHPTVGNVVLAEGETTNPTGTGVRPPSAPGT